MALKSYGKETLNGNWFEERAEDLSGVIPADDNVREFSTTSASNFQQTAQNAGGLSLAEQQRRIINAKRGKPMVQVRNFDMCREPRDTGKPGKGFGSVLPSADNNDEKRYFDTSNRDDFGAGKKTSNTAQRRIKQEQIHASGGHASRPPDRGTLASGATGEVYKTESDPQRNTEAQRSWMYTADPMIIAMKNKQAASSTDTPAEEHVPASPVQEQDFRRKNTSITQNSKTKDGIFADY